MHRYCVVNTTYYEKKITKGNINKSEKLAATLFCVCNTSV